MATLDRRYTILDLLDLTDRTNDLDTKFQEVEPALQGPPQLRSTLNRFRTSLQGFRNWRNSLLAFNGSKSQYGQALLQHEAVEEQLEQLASSLLNLSQHLAESADIRDIPSSQLLSDVVDLDVAVGRLIALFPDARPEAANISLNQAQSASRSRQQALWNPAPTYRTDSAPPNLDEQAEAKDSVPASFPPPLRSASTDLPKRYGRIIARGNSVGQAGDIFDTSTSADASSTPQSPAFGTCYDVIDISENATFHAGNVYRHSSSNNQDFMLAEFPHLRELTIRFKLGRGYDEPQPLPHVTRATAAEIFIYIRGSSPKLPVRLRRLHVYSGRPPPPIRFSSAIKEDLYWQEDNSTSFVCELAERDDDAAQGRFRVICPKLSRELNNKMELVSNGGDLFSLSDANKVAFSVALNGPLPVNEWLELRGDGRSINHAK